MAQTITPERSRRAEPPSAQLQRERFRRRYRPARTRLLFAGEAPPASGRFFYRRDSGLYRAFLEVFRTVDPATTDANFLSVFQAAGCYLVDLCPYPVDRLDPLPRRAACVASEPSLCRTIKRLQPQTIITVVRSIRDNVERAASGAGWRGPLIDLPYPGRWRHHQEIFLRTLVPLIRELG